MDRPDELAARADLVCPLPPNPDTLPRVLGRSQTSSHGLSRQQVGRRLRHGWTQVLPRTYLTCHGPPTSFDRVQAALLFAGDGAALSGQAALWAAGVRRIASPDTVLVLVPSFNCTASHGWARIRRVDRWPDIALAPGPRRVEIARATADLAVGLRGLDDVRALIARVVQDGHCTVAELAVELERGPRRGSKHLRTSLEEVGAGAASAPEARAAAILRAAGIDGFVQNKEVRLADGSVRVLDFYWPELRACLEIDSVEFHFDQATWRATMDRDLQLAANGLSVVHQPPSALHDAAQFVAKIRDWLAGRAAELNRTRR